MVAACRAHVVEEPSGSGRFLRGFGLGGAVVLVFVLAVPALAGTGIPGHRPVAAVLSLAALGYAAGVPRRLGGERVAGALLGFLLAGGAFAWLRYRMLSGLT